MENGARNDLGKAKRKEEDKENKNLREKGKETIIEKKKDVNILILSRTVILYRTLTTHLY